MVCCTGVSFIDMIAIPDFVSGAMEHWGLITYRETNLLYKAGISSPENKQRIAEVIAHELAHQVSASLIQINLELFSLTR